MTQTTEKLAVIDSETLLDTRLAPTKFCVDTLLPEGLCILGGAPKVGKSFLSLQLAYCVSQGLPFLGFKTNQTGVIYFALEDVERRIQHRMQKKSMQRKIPSFAKMD